jgi:hypothetical protein
VATVTEPESPVDLMLACPCGLPDVAQELAQVAAAVPTWRLAHQCEAVAGWRPASLSSSPGAVPRYEPARQDMGSRSRRGRAGAARRRPP